jgi:hypothetical protein
MNAPKQNMLWSIRIHATDYSTFLQEKQKYSQHSVKYT